MLNHVGESKYSTDLHYLNKLEKQLLSVLGFLLLDYQRAHPAGQRGKRAAANKKHSEGTILHGGFGSYQ